MGQDESRDSPFERLLPTIAEARDAFAWLAIRGFGDLPLHQPRAPISTIREITGESDARGVLIEVPNSEATAAGRTFGLLAAVADDATALRADLEQLIELQSANVNEALERLRSLIEADTAGGRRCWQPIESVPVDTRVLVFIPDAEPDKIFAGRWSPASRGMYVWNIENSPRMAFAAPTMWRPMPDPPSAGTP